MCKTSSDLQTGRTITSVDVFDLAAIKRGYTDEKIIEIKDKEYKKDRMKKKKQHKNI